MKSSRRQVGGEAVCCWVGRGPRVLVPAYSNGSQQVDADLTLVRNKQEEAWYPGTGNHGMEVRRARTNTSGINY
eukprot:3767041-Pyramimonas_sp.AAC.1